MADGEGDPRPLLTFRAGGRAFAVDATQVTEIAVAPPLTRVPQAPPALRGLANLRGRAAPVVSLGGDPAADVKRLLVMEGEGAPALAIDEVIALRSADDQAALPEAVELFDLARFLEEAFGATPRRAPRELAEPAAPQARVEDGEDAYLEVETAGQHYGLALASVSAVLARPADRLAVASGDPAATEAVAYREGVIALASLRSLIAPDRPAGSEAMAVVVDVGGVEVGLTVDAVKSVLRIPKAAISAAPALLNRRGGEARVGAVARLQGRLVGLLRPETLFDAATLALLAASAPRAHAAAAAVAEESGETLVLFRVAGVLYGLPATAVREAARAPQRLARPPRLAAFIAGIMNHRGEPLPVIDQARRFGERARAGRLLVVEAGGVTLGLLVDAVEALVRAPAAALQTTPALATAASALFERVMEVETGGGPVLLIDPTVLAAEARRDLKAALAEGRAA